MKRLATFLAALAVAAAAVLAYCHYAPSSGSIIPPLAGKQSVADVVRDIGPAAEARLRPHFEKAGVAYPPPLLTLLALKEEKRLEVWAEKDGRWVFIRDYPILAASGSLGPKLREGDRQVPEGIYRINFMNPNSAYHLSMQIDYPNDFDRRKAGDEGRTGLGGEIFIHGSNVSIGCLAMGDPAIEELFILVQAAGPEKVRVLVAPRDLRRKGAAEGLPATPAWTGELYAALADALRPLAR
jgi:hypothetical protein